MKLHHIGIATNDLNALTDEYLSQGYRIVNDVYDPKQKASLRLLTKDGKKSIELVFSDEADSRVFNLSQKNYKKKYHECYQVNNIDNSVRELKKDGFLLITNIEEAVLLNAKVCFMYKNRKLIELMEEA